VSFLLHVNTTIGQDWASLHDCHNFPEVVVSALSGGHNFPEVVPIMGLEVPKGFVEDLGCLIRWGGLDNEASHGHRILVDGVALVKKEGAGELFNIDDVR